MVAGLAAWALRQPGVDSVLAETDADNTASLRVLQKVGFKEAGRGRESGALRLELDGSVPTEEPTGLIR